MTNDFHDFGPSILVLTKGCSSNLFLQLLLKSFKNIYEGVDFSREFK